MAKSYMIHRLNMLCEEGKLLLCPVSVHGRG